MKASDLSAEPSKMGAFQLTVHGSSDAGLFYTLHAAAGPDFSAVLLPLHNTVVGRAELGLVRTQIGGAVHAAPAVPLLVIVVHVLMRGDDCGGND